jgi:hypothetical protein
LLPLLLLQANFTLLLQTFIFRNASLLYRREVTKRLCKASSSAKQFHRRDAKSAEEKPEIYSEFSFMIQNK